MKLFYSLIAAASVVAAQAANSAVVPGQGSWETTLLGRDLDGNVFTAEAYYDTTLNITWLADTAAATYLQWESANEWAASLDVHGYTGWRLPRSLQPDPSCSGQGGRGNRGQGTPWSFGYHCVGVELGNLFYETLGNVAQWDPGYVGDSGGTNWGPFIGLPGAFWTSTTYTDTPSEAYYFHFVAGSQAVIPKSSSVNAWAVHDGDLGTASILEPVPVPSAIWFLSSGILGLTVFRRRLNFKT